MSKELEARLREWCDEEPLSKPPYSKIYEAADQLERYRVALEAIRDKEWVENALDPQWPADVARQSLEPKP